MTVFCVHLVLDQPQTGSSGVVRVHPVKNHTLLVQAAGKAAVLAQPSSLRGLIEKNSD